MKNIFQSTSLKMAAIGVAATSFGILSCNNQEQENRPNIIFIVADDMGPWTLSVNNDPNTHTPELDKLAELTEQLTTIENHLAELDK